MNKGWLELESDPGLFTLLLEDFGAQGVQVEEIYDLQKLIEGPVYGFIFLFKWIEERRSRRKVIQEAETFVTDEEIVNSMFFAQQLIPNSCASHALLSVLLNCDKLKLGPILEKLKKFSGHMSPEDKGFAIGNMPELFKAHNSHARKDTSSLTDRQRDLTPGAGRTIGDAFHFVSYVPINGRLFELDGLKPYPIDHGPWLEGEEWTAQFTRVITERLGMATGGEPYHDIRFNLMAVVPDRRRLFEQKLSILKTNRQIVLEALQQMVKVSSAEPKPGPNVTTRRMNRVKAAEASVKTEAPDASVSQKKHSSNAPSPCKLPPALDSHNYAKSPLTDELAEDGECDVQIKRSGSDTESDNEVQILEHESELNKTIDPPCDEKTEKIQVPNADQIKNVKSDKVKIHITVKEELEDGSMVTMPTTIATTDVTKPLTIQTKFGSTPSNSAPTSTETASETSTSLYSPLCSTIPQTSPKLEPTLDSKPDPETLDNSQGSADNDTSAEVTQILQDTSEKLKKEESGGGSVERRKPRQGFTPKDLLALLKNVENEILQCENNLRDEVEKRNKYKIDDCRRTHNYDQFICTFLSMLAEQGHLANLVEEHMSVSKRRSGNGLSRTSQSRKPDKRSRKTKTKKRR
ncbi:unnamed protein product [Owenia fusiformis]|uniref:Ubiquitin carboxyl-terminal hydrolase n=1 Tax=Owenia fusiformis TaxID=6347 RepID=A0A8J1XG57_OWEFU|nr:unnamed protein product [Owenia fusiformis]